ncbi:MAG: phytanoyl-CoA hydroxylase, partial [Planctomycetota bacterium]
MSHSPPQINEDDRAAFARDGFIHVPSLLDEATLAELETTYMRFLRGEIPVEGRDFCDMAGEYTPGEPEAA